MNAFKVSSIALVLVSLCGLSEMASAGSTLDAIQKKGYLQCGVSDGLPGFSYTDAQGVYKGIDVDVCHAIAAAVFGDASKVRFSPLNAKERLTALQTGEIDVLSRNTTWTSSRDGSLGLMFTSVTYYDGQGFLINKKLGVKSAKELNGATVCIQGGSTAELNATDYFRANGMNFVPITFDTMEESIKSLEAGRCDVLTTDKSQLASLRIKTAQPEDYVLLPEVISKEPLGPVVRRGDADWFNIVRWTLFAMLNAEEAGITSKNVESEAKTTKNPDVARLLGLDGRYGQDLKLPNDWVVKIVKQVGNYGEVFDRNLGKDTPLAFDRGLNALWNQGGIQYAPPVR